MNPDQPPQRGVIVTTEIEHRGDHDLWVQIVHLHPDDIKLIADAVIANLLRLRLVKPWTPGE